MLFRSGDAEDTCGRKLSILIEDPRLRRAYSEEAYRRVEQAYSPEIALKSYLSGFWTYGLFTRLRCNE